MRQMELRAEALLTVCLCACVYVCVGGGIIGVVFYSRLRGVSGDLRLF